MEGRRQEHRAAPVIKEEDPHTTSLLLKEQEIVHLSRVRRSLEARIAVLEAQESMWEREKSSLLEIQHILADEKNLLMRQLEASRIMHDAAKLHDEMQRRLKRSREGAAGPDLLIIP